jgi:3-carboxy-cis,cis-muconate cycloisomerase
MLALFDDEATIRHALAFEAALAHALAAESLISTEAADRIVLACKALHIEPAVLADEVSLAGTLAIPLVKRLRAELPPHLAICAHKGATSQDLADTVLMIQVKQASTLLLKDAARVVDALAGLATRYIGTPTIGRTLLQDALPISLGLRFAQWRAGLVDSIERVNREVALHARLQFGGAAGTRADLSGRGQAIAGHMAKTLELPAGEPWHARRTGVAGIAAAIGILVGALGKIARDVSLLAQNRIDEIREPVIAGRGGSSAMAHKRNPTGCQTALAAATRTPGLIATVLIGLPAEQERGLGGWQAEGPVLAEIFQLAAASASAMAQVVEGLDINEIAVSANLEAAGVGTDIGESSAIAAILLDIKPRG